MNATNASGGPLPTGSRPQGTRRRVSPPLRRALVWLSGLGSCMALCGPALAQPVDGNLWITNGYVRSVVRAGGTVYIGGDFSHVGPATGGAVALDLATGALSPTFPKVAGHVFAVASDGAGGWYIGGAFTAVGGLPRSGIAHVTSDLVLSDWNPGTNDFVTALAVSGSTVYVGDSSARSVEKPGAISPRWMRPRDARPPGIRGRIVACWRWR